MRISSCWPALGWGRTCAYLRIAKTNQKVSDIAFRAQLIATVTQICDLYWDLVNAYDNEQVGERRWRLPLRHWTTAASSLQLQAIPEMDVLKAEGELATRQQDLTVARTNLELQELYMKNAITPLARRSHACRKCRWCRWTTSARRSSPIPSRCRI